MAKSQYHLRLPRFGWKTRVKRWWISARNFWNKLGTVQKGIFGSFLTVFSGLALVITQVEYFRPKVQFAVSGGQEIIQCKITNVGNFPLKNFNVTAGYTELNAGQWVVSKPYSSHLENLEKGDANSRELRMELKGGNFNRTLFVFALLDSDRNFLIGPRIDTAKFRLLFKGKEWSEPSYDLRELGEKDRPLLRKQMVDFNPRFIPYLIERIYPPGTTSSTVSLEPIEVLQTNYVKKPF